MFVITGITGQVGGIMAGRLLAENKKVRGVVRSVGKGEKWAAMGCEIAVADMLDTENLTEAFRDADGVFILIPPNFDPSPGFSETKAIVRSIMIALAEAGPAKVVCLSTIGAQNQRSNLLSQLTLVEANLRTLPMPVTFLRPGWFIENATWDVEPARNNRVIPSFLQPLDKPFPMVSVADVGQTAARLIREDWTGKRIVELEGPVRYSPNDIADAFARLLGHDVKAEIVPRSSWVELFISQGMHNPGPRISMLDGFNEGWIDFERESIKGKTDLLSALKSLVK